MEGPTVKTSRDPGSSPYLITSGKSAPDCEFPCKSRCYFRLDPNRPQLSSQNAKGRTRDPGPASTVSDQASGTHHDNFNPALSPWAQNVESVNGTIGRCEVAAGPPPKFGIRFTSSTGSTCAPGRTTFVQYRHEYPPNTWMLSVSW